MRVQLVCCKRVLEKEHIHATVLSFNKQQTTKQTMSLSPLLGPYPSTVPDSLQHTIQQHTVLLVEITLRARGLKYMVKRKFHTPCPLLLPHTHPTPVPKMHQGPSLLSPLD